MNDEEILDCPFCGAKTEWIDDAFYCTEAECFFRAEHPIEFRFWIKKIEQIKKLAREDVLASLEAEGRIYHRKEQISPAYCSICNSNTGKRVVIHSSHLECILEGKPDKGHPIPAFCPVCYQEKEKEIQKLKELYEATYNSAKILKEQVLNSADEIEKLIEQKTRLENALRAIGDYNCKCRPHDKILCWSCIARQALRAEGERTEKAKKALEGEMNLSP